MTSELLAPGTELGGFVVGEPLHAGGMGVVYAARRPGSEAPLVMKVPRLGFGEPGETVVTFEVEQTVHAALRGPHVPRFVAAGGLEEGRPWLVMERVEGRPLRDELERAPLPPEEVARLGAAVARALHDVHAQEAIHLDLKPSNVILRPDGEAVLLDFGLAHHAHFPDLLAEEVRHPVGSAPYIAPEQVLGQRGDLRSDLFALGAVLYELATGRLPFGAPTSPAGLRKRLFRDPLPPRAVAPGIPEWLQEVVLRCLEPDPERRHPSAAQLALDLAHPGEIVVTERGRRLRRRAGLRELLRWLQTLGFEPPPPSHPSVHLARAPIVLAAIATEHRNRAELEAVREAARRLLAADPGNRLACVTVIPPAPELGGSDAADTATRRRLRHLAILRHWAEPLGLEPGRVSFHAIEGSDPAAALLAYARANRVDHLVIGGPPPDWPLKRILGTVATRVAVEAPCSVTVVRAR
ncbi:bifunctional serine/threonine-protein kinase/universal stress protein [Anaeromyxobacter paludicola]|uniref:Serine/threonine protein kinase n=1 Tax=Anaeromyxobacter paludicola TaxID=2918171 RepID=A0ABN6NE92_9BACT|nr:bifunctional serine/threonine-protein kinase/universal stress protein [Anaeromyxobacter paludicola]BDG10357.1 serine/threonine protein kinase [Anaeromyxobacter paludicola]